jgi:thiol-disulfide isomerase/thioredoxin
MTAGRWAPYATLRIAAAGAVLCLLAGCAAIRRLGGPPADARLHAISLQDVAAGDLLEDVAEQLEDEDGIHQVEPDLVRAELKVWTRPELAPDALVAALGRRGLQARAGGGQGRYRPPPGYPQDADARVLTAKGVDIRDLKAHVAPGKVTVFDFYADWCGPCHKIDRIFARVLTDRKDVAVRKLNIVQFDSPLARRWVGNSIPYVLIFGRTGKPLFELRGSDPVAVAVALGRATVSKE